MLPPSKSEYDQNDAEEHDLEEQMRAAQAVNQGDAVAKPDDELDVGSDPSLDIDADADPEAESDDLGQDEPKPKKKGIGKGTIIAAVGAVVVVALCGAAYVMQGQMQKPAPVSKKIVVDPSLLDNKPMAAPPANAVVSAPPAALTAPPVASMEITPNLATPTVSSPSGVSSITAPPSDPFGSATTPPMATAAAVAAPTPAPVVLTPAPVVVVPSKSVSITPAPNTDGPRADPFGSVIVEKPAKVEKPVVAKIAKPVAEPVVKAEKPVKAVKVKPAPVAVEDVEAVKPRVVKKAAVRKPSVVRQETTVSEPRSSQERMQPQSSESFQGYEKLF